MEDDRQRQPSPRSGWVKSLENNLSRGEPEILAAYALVGAVLVFGGLGYALDQWKGTSNWFLFVGLFVGIGVGFYNLARTVWPRQR